MCPTCYCSTATCFRSTITTKRCPKTHQIWQGGQNWQKKKVLECGENLYIKLSSNPTRHQKSLISGYFNLSENNYYYNTHNGATCTNCQWFYQDYWVFQVLVIHPYWGDPLGVISSLTCVQVGVRSPPHKEWTYKQPLRSMWLFFFL